MKGVCFLSSLYIIVNESNVLLRRRCIQAGLRHSEDLLFTSCRLLPY